MDGVHLEKVSEVYLGYVLNESGTDDAEFHRKVDSGRKDAGTIKFVVDARGLQLKCLRVLHESCLFCCITVRQ